MNVVLQHGDGIVGSRSHWVLRRRVPLTRFLSSPPECEEGGSALNDSSVHMRSASPKTALAVPLGLD